MKHLTLLIAGICVFTLTKGQLSVDNTAPYNSATYLVNNVLSGNGVTASNITFNGNAAQMGFFNSGNTGTPSLGLDSGIVMSSGDVNDIPPGGNQPDQGQYGGTGDSDLLSIAQSVTTNPSSSSITSTQDAAFLEFDFQVAGDTVEFKFVFASEEYNTYINTQFNDVFAFFLSGPGITGPYASPVGFPNGAVNVALVPGTNDPITISTIYNDPTETPPSLNGQYYINNLGGTNNDFNAFTTVITAKYPVQCGETYHFKFAIADCQDDYLDTGVFLEARSLSSSGVAIVANTALPNNTILEGCSDAEITIIRTDTNFNDTINLNISGNATAADYSFIDTVQIFNSGSDSLTFNVSAIVDNVPEGIDTLIIEILGNTGCNMVTLLIEDYTPMSITVSDSINICTELGDTAQIWANVTNGRPPYFYDWDSGMSGDTLLVAPEETTYYIPTVYDACGNSITGDEVPVWVQCQIIPTNVFTPNGDGHNDYFSLINLDDYPNPTVKIYNRWGKLVYENESYQNDWDGGDLPDGTYFYIVLPNNKKYEYDSGASKEDLKYTIKGYVQLFR